MPPQQSNQYDFILDSKQKRRSGPAFLQNPRQRNIVMVLFVSGVLLIVILGWSLISSIGKQNTADLVELAAYQSEFSRLSDDALDNAQNNETRYEAATLHALASSDLQRLRSYLSANGVTLSPQQLAAKQSSARTTSLEQATQASRFDEEYITAIDELMVAYRQDLQQALNNSSGANRDALLETLANNLLAYQGSEE